MSLFVFSLVISLIFYSFVAFLFYTSFGCLEDESIDFNQDHLDSSDNSDPLLQVGMSFETMDALKNAVPTTA